MENKLEEILVLMNAHINEMEDEIRDKKKQLAAKQLYITACLKQLDLETKILSLEWDLELPSLMEEQAATELWKKSHEEYVKIMDSIFNTKCEGKNGE
jgi:hypothetical protein